MKEELKTIKYITFNLGCDPDSLSINLLEIKLEIYTSFKGANMQRGPFTLAIWAAILTCDFLLLMYVNEWMSYECSNQGTYRVHTQNIHNYFTRSHASEEDRTRRSPGSILMSLV
jgi:hypothetical protein